MYERIRAGRHTEVVVTKELVDWWKAQRRKARRRYLRHAARWGAVALAFLVGALLLALLESSLP